MLHDDSRARLVSEPGELPFEHYLRIENSDVPPEEAAARIKAYFDL